MQYNLTTRANVRTTQIPNEKALAVSKTSLLGGLNVCLTQGQKSPVIQKNTLILLCQVKVFLRMKEKTDPRRKEWKKRGLKGSRWAFVLCIHSETKGLFKAQERNKVWKNLRQQVRKNVPSMPPKNYWSKDWNLCQLRYRCRCKRNHVSPILCKVPG